MHTIEPFYNWRNFYTAEDDKRSPFYRRQYSEFEFEHEVYGYYIHPQWDEFESSTLFMKILFTDYDDGFAILEFIGEWNDCLYNDIMHLKRNVIDELSQHGINKYILIGENVMNFHASDDSYYEEWYEDVEDGWIALVNFRDHVIKEFEHANIDNYFVLGGSLEDIDWRTFNPDQFFQKTQNIVMKRLG